jgi:cysteine desulfurase
MRAETVLVSVMAANNEVGTLQPVAELGVLCRTRNILFHSDAVQAVGRVPLDVASTGVDLMSLSAHKMYGPKGVGALYCRRSHRPRIRLEPQAEGGGQERGLRSGTLNVAGIVGFGEAAQVAARALHEGEPERILRLRDRLLEALRCRVEGLTVNASLSARVPGNLSVSIAGVEAETLILSIGDRVAISSGAACAEAGGRGSHVLRAMGLPDERIFGALRFGLGRGNTEAEIDSAVDQIAAAVENARRRFGNLRG